MKYCANLSKASSPETISKTRKIMIVLLCGILLFTLCSCGSNNKKQGEFADQEKFLKDMATGVTNRAKHANDGKEYTGEELYALYETLVAYELSQVEKYENQVFADELFNDLAHAYIDACQIQRIQAENYKINNLDDLWSSGYAIRCAIITEFYERYNLPISSETAATYQNNNTGLTLSTPKKEISSNDISIQMLPVWNNSFPTYFQGLLITNDSAECTVNVTITVTFYDSNGNIVDTEQRTEQAIGAGETHYSSCSTNKNFEKAEYQINDVTTETFYVSLTKDFEVTATENAGNIIVEAKNDSDISCSRSYIVAIFYLGNDIVEVGMANISHIIHAGESSVGTIHMPKENTPYTHYELYYYFYGYES